MKRIEISQPYIDKTQALINITEALETGIIAQGPQVLRAEEMMTALFESAYAAALANGTASLRAGLVAAIAQKQSVDKKYVDRYVMGKEIIIPAFSFNATLNTVLQIGATARIVDINREDFCLDRTQATGATTDNTAAVIPVDLYGQPADISSRDTEFSSLAVVRDAAQAHGSKLRGESIVRHGDATSLSFYPTKNIAAPEGGAVLTDCEDIDNIVRIYRNQGMSQRYVYEMAGDNLRMSDIHAAVLRANLGGLALVTSRRQTNAGLLSEHLQNIPGITIPEIMAGREHVWHQYTILVEDEFGLSRDELALGLQQRGVGTGVYYPKTMSDHSMFEQHPRVVKQETPVADEVAKRVLSLPVHPGVSEADIDRIAVAIDSIQKENK